MEIKYDLRYDLDARFEDGTVRKRYAVDGEETKMQIELWKLMDARVNISILPCVKNPP